MDYIGDNKFISFILKPRMVEKGHFDNLSELMQISKETYGRFKQKETEAFFICSQELSPNNYVWYWELMPEVLIWKQKYGKPIHTVFREYLVRKLERDGLITIYIAHINHPNYITLKYTIPNRDYLHDCIDFMRTYKMEYSMGVGIATPPIGKSFDLVKIGIVDKTRKLNIYYNIYKYTVEILPQSK